MINGAKMKALREKTGLTTTQLGEEVGVSQSMIAFMEGEKKTPRFEVVVRVAKRLGATVDDLIKEGDS